eukprot:187714-Prorocentrum_minimum.AAC.7
MAPHQRPLVRFGKALRHMVVEESAHEDGPPTHPPRYTALLHCAAAVLHHTAPAHAAQRHTLLQAATSVHLPRGARAKDGRLRTVEVATPHRRLPPMGIQAHARCGFTRMP